MAREDDEDAPFRLSLFLPAEGDTASMRGMKYAVIGMGIVLILGFLTIVARIVYLTSRTDARVEATTNINLAFPAGTEISSMALSNNRIALHLKGPMPGDRSIAIVDLATGSVISRISLPSTNGDAARTPPIAPVSK